MVFVVLVATHSSFCGSMNVKGLVAEDAAHLKLNGSLCKRTHAHQPIRSHTQPLPVFAVKRRVHGGCEDMALCMCACMHVSISFYFGPFCFFFFAELVFVYYAYYD